PGWSGIIAYVVFDPLNFTGLGGGRVIARFFKDGKILGGSEKFKPEKTELSSQNAAAEIGGNEILKTGGGYGLRGKIGGVEWNLDFKAELDPIFAFKNAGFDPLNLEKVSWLIEAPFAKVSGKIALGKTKIPISASGYCDSNWGNFLPLASRFNWGQFNGEKISVVFGETENLELGSRKIGRRGEVFVIFKGKKIRFSSEEFTVKNSGWSASGGEKTGRLSEKVFGERKMPKITLVEAQNEKYKLRLAIEAKMTDPIYLDTPLLLKPTVIEQLSFFEGELFKKTSRRDILLAEISGAGFKEYMFMDFFFAREGKSGVAI
ncbi:MAG: hypothetical protein AAB851_01345, partial [Patescibacteria group bacterium]